MKNLHDIILISVRDFVLHISRKSLPLKQQLGCDEKYAKAAAMWLLRSIDNGAGGSSSHYNLILGCWRPPFPETTGYIIPTLLNYYDYSNNSQFLRKALKISDWLLQVQISNGACMLGHYRPEKSTEASCIFNTGQNILGFVEIFQRTSNQKYLEAAIKAGDFLVNSTDDNLIWNKYLHNNIPHTYNSRTSWSLLNLYKVTDNKTYKNVATSNLEWVLEQQNSNGWFHNCNFKVGEYPNLHGIAYTIRGLLESYKLTNNEKFLEATLLTAEKLMKIFEIRKEIPTFWDQNWKSYNKFPMSNKYFKPNFSLSVCLTGYAQFSIVLMKLYEITGDLRFFNTSLKLVDFLKFQTNIKTSNANINGALAGSFPVYGDYSFMSYPNWATKFFLDSLLLQIKCKKAWR